MPHPPDACGNALERTSDRLTMTGRFLAKTATGANSTVASGKASLIPGFVKTGRGVGSMDIRMVIEEMRHAGNLEPSGPFDRRQEEIGDMELPARVELVTGAGSGLGKAADLAPPGRGVKLGVTQSEGRRD